MNLRKSAAIACLSLLTAMVIVQPALVNAFPVHASAMTVSFSYNPSTVTVNSQTMISYSIVGGSPAFTIWVNNTPPGCSPPSVPFTTSNVSGSFPCTPTVVGNYNNVHVDVHDSAGNRASTQTSLTVTGSTGGSGGSGSGSNGTGGIDLSFLNNLLPIVMITGFVFLGATVAIAASAVALAVLVPRRLKQIRKALEGEPVSKTEPAEAKVETPKDQPTNEP